MATALWQAVETRVPNRTLRRWLVPTVVIVALAAVGMALGDPVPTWLDAHVKPFFDSIYKWTVDNRASHWLFVRVFSPISHALTWSVNGLLWIMRNLRWTGMAALTGFIGYRTGGLRAALIGTLCLMGCGVLGLWDATLQTLALMLVAVIISLIIGVPLGIWAGLNDKADRRLRGLLDTSQVLPTFVYLLPAVVAFSIKEPPAVVVTVIYAVAPVVRLTSLGIRNVPVVAVEVGESFGCTPGQLLRKVRLPMARRTILLGLNQVIMMAFGVVVIAALVGTGGLGQEVLKGLQKNNVGKAFAAGLALVLLAVSLDRITTGERRANSSRGTLAAWSDAARGRLPASRWTGALLAAGAILAAAIIAHLLGVAPFPSSPRLDVVKPVNDATKWVAKHARTGVPVIGGTKSVSDFVTLNLLNPVRDGLLAPAWWVIVLIVGAIGWASGGWRLAGICGSAMLAIAALRVWDLAMDTLGLVLVAVLFSLLIAIPLGIWAGRSDHVNAAIRPFLDAAQVMPQFVYLVPVLLLFGIGHFPGLVASVVYAIPPGIRLISLGMREVPMAPREAAISFGATPRQEMVKVQIPLAVRAIMLGINQTIMMVLSVVVIAALIGAGGLGLETVYGLTKTEIGRGVAGGAAIVMLAIVLDRLTQAWGAPRRALRPVAEVVTPAH